MNPLITFERKVLKKDYKDNDGIKIGKGTILEPLSVIYPGCKIGRQSVIGTSAILKKKTVVGNHTIIGSLTNTEGNCTIGNWTTIHAQCHLTDGLKIGNQVFIAPFFCAANTPKISTGKFGYPNTTHDERSNCIVEDGVRMGVGVQMIPGVRVGHHALIDMCTLLTKDVKPYCHIRSGGGLVGKEVLVQY